MFELVINIQRKTNHEIAILKLIEQFNPLIKKYSNLLRWEDSQSELILALIEIINKVPTQNSKFKQDKYIVSYISKSIRNTYIYLSKIRNKLKCHEFPINFEITEDSYQASIVDRLFVEELLKVLTKREKEIITLKYFNEYSDIEISRKIGVSRQAVNKTKNRAIKRMREYMDVS